MAGFDLSEYDDIVEEAQDSLVVSVVMLMAGIFSFSISVILIQLVSIGHSPVSGNFLALSAAILSAAVVMSSARAISN